MTEGLQRHIPMANTQVRATWVLLVINLVIFFFTGIVPLIPLEIGWKENRLIAQGEYWRLLTATFLHADFMHMFANTIGIIALGRLTEPVYGVPRFLAIYIVSGLAGSVVSYSFSPYPSVGASGAIFGLVGALAIFFYTTRHIFGQYSRTQVQGMVAWMVIATLAGLGMERVDNFGHMGGLLGGLLVGWIVAPRYVLDRRFLPPVLERKESPLAWVGVVGVLIILGLLVWFITPPLRPFWVLGL